jgi:hypothetical protein
MCEHRTEILAGFSPLRLHYFAFCSRFQIGTIREGELSRNEENQLRLEMLAMMPRNSLLAGEIPNGGWG